jgi:hypothetical protein
VGPQQTDQAALFCEFSLERHVPASHLLRSIDRFVDLSGIRSEREPFYSSSGRPSIVPELLVRMLLLGCCYGIRSERRLCEEAHLNLAYRWLPAWPGWRSAGPFNLLQEQAWPLSRLRSVAQAVRDGRASLYGGGTGRGAGFAVDASLIAADANKQRSLRVPISMTRRASPERADRSGNISTRWMRQLGAQQVRRCRSSSPEACVQT